MHTPWGNLPVADAHIHFFSHRFFQALAEQKKIPMTALESTLDWQIPAQDPEGLATTWAAELDRHGVAQAALIASVPGDHESVSAAVRKLPQRFKPYVPIQPYGIAIGRRHRQAHFATSVLSKQP